MPRLTPSAGSRVRAAAILFGAWLLFFALLSLLSVALAPATAQRGFDFSAVEVTAAALWTALSLAIAAYHRRLRAIVPNLIALIAAHIPMLVVAAIADAAITSWAVLAVTGNAPKLSVLTLTVYYFDFDIVAYVVVVAVAEVLLVRRALAERQRQAERLESSLARARLDYLEAQLQPHFLFNSLGAVSELAYDAPATATRVLRQLAAIFRAALGKKTDEVTLGEELVGIEPYLDIQRIRFADWLTIDYRIDDGAVDCLVPRFVLQPLIENAIRHGLSGRSAAGTIEIVASLSDSSLIVRVVDDGVGLEAAPISAGRGIGLANVRDRLRILYGDDDSLRLTNNESGGAVAELRIPARRHDTASPLTHTKGGDEFHVLESVRSLSIPAFLRRPAAAIVVGWLLAGILWTQQSFVYLILRDRLKDATWLSLAKTDMASAAIWALLTPIVFMFAKQFPLRRDGIAWRVGVYAIAVGLIVVLHNFVWQRLMAPEAALFSPPYQMSFIVGFLIACILVAIGHRRVLADWLRDREADAELLRAELSEARERAVKLQAIPPVLLRALDGIAETARRDAALTERQLTRLADYLRIALECTDERGITPDRERALDLAVAELRHTGAYSLTLSA